MSSAHNVVDLPSPKEAEDAKSSGRTLSKYADSGRVHMSIKGKGGVSDELILPGKVVAILLDVLSNMAQGKATSLIPLDAIVTTQEAANILNVSRPFLIKLLENKQIPFTKTGAHRRIRLEDVMHYKEQTDSSRQETLDELAKLSQEEGMGY